MMVRIAGNTFTASERLLATDPAFALATLRSATATAAQPTAQKHATASSAAVGRVESAGKGLDLTSRRYQELRALRRENRKKWEACYLTKCPGHPATQSRRRWPWRRTTALRGSSRLGTPEAYVGYLTESNHAQSKQPKQPKQNRLYFTSAARIQRCLITALKPSRLIRRMTIVSLFLEQ